MIDFRHTSLVVDMPSSPSCIYPRLFPTCRMMGWRVGYLAYHNSNKDLMGALLKVSE